MKKQIELMNKENYNSDIENVNLLTFEYVKILHEYLMTSV